MKKFYTVCILFVFFLALILADGFFPSNHITQQWKKILVVADDDGLVYYRGTSLSEFELALKIGGYAYEVWLESVRGHPSISDLSKYELVIWTCGDFGRRPIDLIDAETLKEYHLNGGNILIEGERVAYEAEADFHSQVLHINYLGYFGILPSGLRVSLDHPITEGLGNLSWKIPPKHLDRVTPATESYDVMRFIGEKYESYFNRTAVSVFEGTSTGSVIYYTFSIFSLPQSERNRLVKQSIEWLFRSDLSTVGVRLVNAPTNSIYFIYADPTLLTVNETFGMVAGATIYGLCKNPQNQGFDSTRHWLVGGKINSTEINNTIVVLAGNPNYHSIVRRYEDDGVTPVSFYENQSHFMFLDQEGSILVCLTKEEVKSGVKDAFVIYTFTERDNDFLVIYGFGWKGTWAAGRFFTHKMWKNIREYSLLKFIVNTVEF